MRRSNGEGSRGRRADGRYYVTVMHLGKRLWFYGDTQRAATNKFKEWRRELERGLDQSNRDQSVEAFLLQYYSDVAAPSLAPYTLHRYKEIIDLYLVPRLGKHRLRELNPRHVQTFLNELPTALAGNTVSNIRALLRRALNVALSWHLVEYNAAQAVTLPKRPLRKKVQALEPSQVAAFFTVLREHPRAALYRVATVLGLRKGELLALEKADIDLGGRTLRVERQIQELDNKIVVRPTKTEASRRTLTLPELLVPDLERQLQEQPDCSLLFPSEAGTYIRPRNLSRQFKLLLKEAGLPASTRFHDLRHTAGSFALAAGMDVKTTQEMLGHTQASTTLNVYGHSLRERRANVVNTVVNAAFGVDSAAAETQE